MADYQITCITKSLPYGGYEHITHVGNQQHISNAWKLPVAVIVNQIDTKTNTFYVLDSRTGKTATVGVVRPTHGQPYLRTYADGVWNDNLLSLPQCL
jgi:hypothetical protein